MNATSLRDDTHSRATTTAAANDHPSRVTTHARTAALTANSDGHAAADSLWRSAPLIAVLLVVAAGALLPSFVAIREYAAHIGAHRELIWGAPLCLDGLALSAAYAWIDRHARGLPTGSAPWAAVGAALATLAVNALHANPDLLDPVVGLVALSLLAPIAAFAAFHIVFESLAHHRNPRTTARATAVAREPDRATGATDTQHAPETTGATALSGRNDPDRSDSVVARPAQEALRDGDPAQPKTRSAAREHRDANARITRTVATKHTTITELIDEIRNDTSRHVAAEWLHHGGDLHDSELTTRVKRALGRSRRTAQYHLQPARQAAQATAATREPSSL